MIKSSILSCQVDQDTSVMKFYTLHNDMGNTVVLSNYGARIVKWMAEDKEGKMDNIVLGYPLLSDYLDDKCYLGATIGRVANRISKARFCLDGELFTLDPNDGENTNHGGFEGIDRHIFRCTEQTDNRVVFTTEMKDGQGGFPGCVSVEVAYTLSEENQLRIDYRATTDKKTVLNLTNHAYFNLSGCCVPAVRHFLQIRSSRIVASDKQYIPSGEVVGIDGTRWDFSELSAIDEQSPGLGYNEYYIIDGQSSANPAATLYDPVSGRVLDLYTSYPGIFFYSADYLSSVHVGSFGRKFVPYDGVCLEAQLFPDAVNRPEFPGIELNVGEVYQHYMIFHLHINN